MRRAAAGLAAACAAALLVAAPATAGGGVPRVASIEHGDVVAQELGGPPQQLTHDGRLRGLSFSVRGDLAATTSTRLLVRSADGAQRSYPFDDAAPPPAWSPDGRLLVAAYADALHVIDVDARRVRRIPLPKVRPAGPGARRWGIFGVLFGHTPQRLYVLAIPTREAPADQGKQRLYWVDPTAESPALHVADSRAVLGNLALEYGAASPSGRYYAAPLWEHSGACSEYARVAVIDLRRGRLTTHTASAPGATRARPLPAIGSVGWADEDTLLLTAKPYSAAECAAGRMWRAPASLYRQQRDGGRLVRVARGVDWFVSAGGARVQSRCPVWPIALPGEPTCDGAPLVAVAAGSATRLAITGGPAVLVPQASG